MQRDFVSGTAQDPSRIELRRREAPPRWTHLAKRLVLESLWRDGRDGEVLQPFELGGDLLRWSYIVQRVWKGEARARLGSRTIAMAVSDVSERELDWAGGETRLVVGEHGWSSVCLCVGSGSSERSGTR